ncbi:MAG: diguanylate cyclase [Magnetococcales bacterium]|nr:diguanylate cyclase [Magnetococcales bacterium]
MNTQNILKTPLILVADDDEVILDLIDTFLKENGYESILVTNGHEAVDAYKKHNPDLALLDADMPDMDGFQACELIRTIPGSRQTPIVMVTVLSDDDSVNLAFAVGAEDYITKPIHWAVLRQRIRILLDRKEAQERIQHQATHDELTDLPNRTLFMDRLRSAISMCERRNTQMGLMFVDLDRFKMVNDELGHAAGDQLLKDVSARMLACIRQTDTVARMGGDEFTVVLSEISVNGDPVKIAEKILQSLQKPFDLEGEVVRISASIGITIIPQDGNDIETLLRNADHAMYLAKKRGRNCYCLFETVANSDKKSD